MSSSAEQGVLAMEKGDSNESRLEQRLRTHVTEATEERGWSLHCLKRVPVSPPLHIAHAGAENLATVYMYLKCQAFSHQHLCAVTCSILAKVGLIGLISDGLVVLSGTLLLLPSLPTWLQSQECT